MTGTLHGAVSLFVLAGAATVAFGIYITFVADELAERTRLGRAVVGAIFLGALTSVAEIGTSISAALAHHAELAVTNAVGSIAAQTAFIAVADLAYRHANLEHAAASESNLMLSALLLAMLGLLLLAASSPALSWWQVHPVSVGLFVTYAYGMRVVARSGEKPMWRARWTPETSPETSRRISRSASVARLTVKFIAAGMVLVVSGVLLASSGIALVQLTGISESFVGALLTGVTSSMPELVTAITAVRIGALSLAIANIVGGNLFDTTIVGLSDLAYPGSIFQDAGTSLPTLLSATLIMNTVVLLGLLRRERYGLGNIGLEGVLLLAIYGSVVIWLAG